MKYLIVLLSICTMLFWGCKNSDSEVYNKLAFYCSKLPQKNVLLIFKKEIVSEFDQTRENVYIFKSASNSSILYNYFQNQKSFLGNEKVYTKFPLRNFITLPNNYSKYYRISDNIIGRRVDFDLNIIIIAYDIDMGHMIIYEYLP